jgi:hypothetical protein
MAEVEASMSHVHLAAAVIVVGLTGIGPARAEFFGCNDRPGQVLYDSGWHHGAARTSRSYSRDYSAQPRHYRQAHVTYSSAPRYYDSRYR